MSLPVKWRREQSLIRFDYSEGNSSDARKFDFP